VDKLLDEVETQILGISEARVRKVFQDQGFGQQGDYQDRGVSSDQGMTTGLSTGFSGSGPDDDRHAQRVLAAGRAWARPRWR